jgi:hypothetical protein
MNERSKPVWIINTGKILTVARLRKISLQPSAPSRKRKSPDSGLEVERRPSPFDRRLQQDSRTPSASRSSSVSSSIPSTSSTSPDVYNGVLDEDDDGFIFCRPVSLITLSTYQPLTLLGIRSEHCCNLYQERSFNRDDTSRIPSGRWGG